MKGSGVVFTHGEGISTPHVRHKGRQPLIECAHDFDFYVPFYVLISFLYFFFFWFLSSWKVNNGDSWICIWNDPNQASMAWVASRGNQSLNPESSSKIYPSIRCSLSFSFLSFSRKMRNWFSFDSCLIVCFWVNHACAFDFPVFLLNLELIWS